MDLGPQASVHKPFLIPHGFQCSCSDFAKQGGDVWSTKGAKPILRRVVHIGIAIVEGSLQSREHQESMKVCLEKYVDMHPLTQVTAVSHIAWIWVDKIGWLIEATLHGQPGRKVRHVVGAAVSDCQHRRDFLFQCVGSEVARLIEKL